MGCEKVGQGKRGIGAASNCPEEMAGGADHHHQSPPHPAQMGRSQNEPAYD